MLSLGGEITSLVQEVIDRIYYQFMFGKGLAIQDIEFSS